MQLRPYQKESYTAVFEQWQKGIRKTLLVLPTGTGKTIVFSKVIEEKVRSGERVLVLAHRGELLDQAADKLEKSGIKVGTKNPYNRNSDAFAELENGRIDAVIVSYPYAVTQSKEDKNFKVINDPIQGCDLVAISVKGTDSLTKEYNKALKTLKDNGKYDDIAKKWLAVQE